MLPTWGTATFINPATLFAAGEQGAWYDPSDNTTMFQDAAGTTPVTAVEQAVGATLDKRSLSYSAAFDASGQRYSVPASSEFAYGTGAFTVEAWVYPITFNDRFVYSQTASGQNYFGLNISSTRAVIFIFGSGGGTTIATPSSAIAANTWSHVAVVREGTGTDQTKIYVNGVQQAVGTCSFNFTNTTYNPTVGGYTHTTSNAFGGYISNLRVVKGAAVYTGAFTPSGPLSPISGTSLLTAGINWSGNPAVTNSGATIIGLNPFGSSVGNHAYQTTSASRPTLRARYNLLTYSEAMASSYIAIGSTFTNTPSITTPSGAPTSLLIPNTSFGTHGVTFLVAFGPGTFTYSFEAKANGYPRIGVRVYDGTAYRIYATIDISSGLVVGTPVGTVTITDLGSGWWRISIVSVGSTGSMGSTTGWVIESLPAANTVQNNFIGDGVSGAYLSKADIRYGSSAGTYQRIAAATDYATGAAFPQYLAFDGTDDSLLTASVDFTGTDKMTVWSGVSKLNDTLSQLIELSADVNSNNGAFSMPPSVSSGTYSFSSKGTAISTATSAASFSAPITNVLTGIGNISGDIAQLRINGTAAATSTTDQGTGNFGNYALFIGRRNNATIPFNGRIYSLIVRGAASNTTQVAQTEKWVASKTPLWSVP